MLERAVLTSFKKSEKLDMPCYSIAVYQPEGFDYPKLDSFDIRLDCGLWVRPRLFDGHMDKPLEAYAEVLGLLYNSRAWEFELQPLPEQAALCCWCPYDRAAQRQLQEHGSFVCHSAVVGKALSKQKIQVVHDRDRADMVRFE